ncbi:PEPxxWA-CTERM sorting domain-containing protein [Sphingomonas sp. MMSM20]|nr:PEPxxWA-CTERM sorting domain-containing protein [Sphingomonas lycopersici]
MMVNKRRWRKGLTLAGLLIATGTGAGYVAGDKNGLGAGISAASAAVTAALADPLAMFTDRSPGGRAAGALTQTKGPRERVATNVRHRPPAPKPATPVERVLTSLRERPPIIADVPDLPFGATPPYVPPTDIISPPVGPGPVPIVPFIPPLTNGGGSSGGGCCTPPVTPPVTPPGGVPEPATWAMMLIGFFSIGAALRRRGRVVTIVADR